MAKLLNVSGEVECSVKKIKGAKPCGSQIMVEMLTAQETLGTNLSVVDSGALKVTPQAYVRAVGPSVDTKGWGFSIGDRVLISGSGVMVPNYDGNHREVYFMEPHCIKGVLSE